MSDLPAERYALLLERFRQAHVAENGHEHGWKTAAARRLGRSQGYISQVVFGTKGVGAESLQKAMEAFGLPPEYFYDLNADVQGLLDQASLAAHETVEYENPRRDDPGYVDPVVKDWLDRFGKLYPKWVQEEMAKPTFSRHGKAPTIGELTDVAEIYLKMGERSRGSE